MIGVTMSSPEFEGLAVEAQKRFTKCTGLPCMVMHTNDEKNYATKFDAITQFDQTVVWFDADLWFIRECDLSEFDDREEFMAVQDPGIHDPNHFPFHDAKTLKIDLLKYFNSGFFICNKRHLDAINEARRILQSSIKLKDFGEQSSLNAGVQRKTKLRLLSNSFNYIPFAEVHRLRAMRAMRDPLTVHGAGYGIELKEDALRFYESFFTQKFCRASISGHP